MIMMGHIHSQGHSVCSEQSQLNEGMRTSSAISVASG